MKSVVKKKHKKEKRYYSPVFIEEEVKIQEWIDEGLKKGYDLEYLMEIVEVYKLEKEAYEALIK